MLKCSDKKSKKKWKTKHWFLFNDILVYATHITYFGLYLNKIIDIDETVDVVDVPNSLQIKLVFPDGAKSIVMQTSNLEEKTDWLRGKGFCQWDIGSYKSFAYTLNMLYMSVLHYKQTHK